ncbi:hypothetical protein O7626_39400 [Micromonospora sp. WMMD1102]|uniref:hypothetical protein n=1 Tax=Micromonospora sp. WMMD1102 TaxID=3016105 RepID=UPI0024154BE1|nr:hypothetical protein [Micromonospora sp. WMMD1102]MDG4791882.1 hypothetical protein [Micromonospora sp. WMMD1102]
MYQAIGPITARLLIEHGDRAEPCAAWWPPRLHPAYARPAADGWHCGRPYPPAGPSIEFAARQSPGRPGSTVAATAA